MQGDENLYKFESDRPVEPIVDGSTSLIDAPGEAVTSSEPGEAATSSEEETVTSDQADSIQLNAGQDESVPGNSCSVCRQPLSRIFLNVDGNTLIMESCDGCDLRRWQLAGKRIDLKRALVEVEEHVSRSRQ